MDIVIKDGNRTVNWQFKGDTTLNRALKTYARGYYPFRRDTIRLNGRRLLQAHLDCKLDYFAEKYGKLVFQVESVVPENEEKEVAENG